MKKTYTTPEMHEFFLHPESCLTTSLVAHDAQLDDYDNWVKSPNPR